MNWTLQALFSLLDMGWALQALSVLAAPGFGLAGVWLGGHLQAKKDDERWRRELGREDERWHREDDRKWLDEKLHIYTRLLADLTQAFESSRRAYDPHAPYSTLRDDAEQTRLKALAHADLMSADEALLASVLLAGPRVNQIAMALRNSLLITYAMGPDAGTDVVDERIFEARVMLNDLRRLVREDLGVDASDDDPLQTDAIFAKKRMDRDSDDAADSSG